MATPPEYDNVPSFRLDGKVAIVTGGSRGIGEAIARAFAASGAAVVVASRKIEGVQQVAADIEKSGGKAAAIAAHTGKPEDVQALVRQTVERFGKVDVLVNNAGTNPYFGPLSETPDAAFDKTFEVNLKGYFWTAREVIHHLQERKAPGSIVNVASTAALQAAPMQGVYGMTKAAVISMTKTLALELGADHIRVNAIAPGLVETRLASALVTNEELHNHIVSRTPVGRHGQPPEIAGAALFLASEASSYVTGATLVVDGGMTIS
jgi:NAD(P)-dependent dehydrogenase (short-subunit alcohol dehydrogenase family)